jgi:CheY-like chemotaxis protein
MDRGRNEGIVRTFTGTFGLEELGEKQHITIQDIAIKIMKEDKRMCYEVGANDYLAKPINQNALISMLKAWSK